MSYFQYNYNNLHYSISSEKEIGLRNAQIGAIHAIGAYITLNKKLPGIIVMPTGSGKTSVIMMTPYLALSKKVLIITSSKIVRGQIYDDFYQLDTLKKINVFHLLIDPPNVYELKNLYDKKNENKIKSSDCVIATYQCALSLSKNNIKDIFDLVIIDEAHHIPAPKWEQILANMKYSRHFLFTATPFRMDNKELKGEIIYNYPLSLAYQDCIFGDIQYIPIKAAPEKDLLIAKETEQVFLNDKLSDFKHFIMVRTSSKENAKQLEVLYAKETSLRLKRIDSSMTFRIIRNIIDMLKKEELDGIICVNMLGEGFDFPNLKIAAIHDPHKSLASTLQFIGRFARTNAQNIGTAKFIAMNDEALSIESYNLYTQDAIWQKMILDMSELRIHSEEEIKKSLVDYQRDDGIPIWEDNISLYSLRPNYHAKVFRIEGFNINGKFPKSCCVTDKIYRNTTENTIIAIGTVSEKPKWVTSEQILDTTNYLYIIHFQQDTSLLFIYSQIKTEIDYQEIAESFSTENKKIIRSEIHRILSGLSNFEFFNTGMQNRTPDRGESYKILAGSNVAASIDPTTGRLYSPGHVFCKAVNNDDNDITIGYSSGSKIWSSRYELIPDYIKWCDTCGYKIADNSLIVKTNTNYDSMPMPHLLKKYPDKIIFCTFHNKTFSSPPIVFDENGNLTQNVLTDSNINIDKQQENALSLEISIDGMKDNIICDVNGNYSCIDPNIKIKNGRTDLYLYEYLNIYPLVYKVSDGTIIIENELFEGDQEIPIFSSELIRPIDWDNYQVDINCEFENPKNGKITIQKAIFELLSSNDNEIIIYDHGTGEIADFITIKENEEAINIELYHIKAMKGIKYNDNLEDIYEVCQQGIKSLVWLKSSSYFLNKILKRQKNKHCVVCKGNIDKLKIILRKNKQLNAKIVIVQPAISKNENITEKFQEILAAANMYIKNSGRATDFYIWGS